MPWVKLDLPDGRSVTAHVKMPAPRRKRCVGCRQLIDNKRLRQCDARLKATSGKTCDAYVCVSCATNPKQGIDLCPGHAAAWRELMKKKEAEMQAARWPHIGVIAWRRVCILAQLERMSTPATARDLSAALALDLTTLATELKWLDRQGIVHRRQRPANERSMGGAFLYSLAPRTGSFKER